MGDPYTKLPTGATVSQMSRTVYNDTIDMLSWWRSHVRSGPGRSGSIDYNQAVFLAKNGVGSALPAYSVVGIDGPLFEPGDNLQEFLNKTVLSIVAPDDVTHATAFGVTMDICGTGEITRVCVSGMTPVLLSVGAEGDMSAGIVDGAVTHLSTGGQGVPILWKDAAENEDGNGRRWGLVLLGGSGASIPPGTTTNDILRWEADESGSSSSSGAGGGRWVIEPAPSDSGEWVLAVVEGVMQWREVRPFTCGDESSSGV